MLLWLVAEWLHKIQFLGNENHPKDGSKVIRTSIFFIFWHIFDDFCQVFQHLCTSLWKIIKNGKNLTKNEEKPCSTFIQPITQGHFHNPKPNFGKPGPSLPSCYDKTENYDPFSLPKTQYVTCSYHEKVLWGTINMGKFSC